MVLEDALNISINQAMQRLDNGEPVYRYSFYWQKWNEVLSISYHTESRLYSFRERGIEETAIRHHTTQLGKRDRLTSDIPENAALWMAR